MSQKYRVEIADTGPSPVAVGMSALGTAVVAVGAVAIIAGVQTAMLCANGALAIGGAAAAAWQDDQRTRLQGGTAELRRFKLNFRDLAAETFGAVIEERYGQLGRAGTLQMAHGEDLPLEYSAFAENGAFLFGLHRTEDGALEAFCSGEQGVRAVHQASMYTVEKLAQQILRGNGYRRKVDAANQRVIYSRGRGENTEYIMLWYDAATASLQIDTRTVAPDGGIRKGEECPELSQLVAFFRSYDERELTTASPVYHPMSGDPGAAQHPRYRERRREH